MACMSGLWGIGYIIFSAVCLCDCSQGTLRALVCECIIWMGEIGGCVFDLGERNEEGVV